MRFLCYGDVDYYLYIRLTISIFVDKNRSPNSNRTRLQVKNSGSNFHIDLRHFSNKNQCRNQLCKPNRFVEAFVGCLFIFL